MHKSLKIIHIILKDPNRKHLFRILFEYVHFCWLKKGLTIDYFRSFLYRKNVKEYKNHLSLKEFYSIIESPVIKKNDIVDIIENKLKFGIHAKKMQLPLPKTVCYNQKDAFYSDNEKKTILNTADLKEHYLSLLNQNDLDQLFIKPVSDYGGSNCFLFTKDNIDSLIKNYGDLLLNNDFIYQEVIIQNSIINQMYPKAVNTIRLDTYLDKNNEAHILSGVMRFGANGNIMDNVSSGGFFASINFDKETLQGLGMQFINKGGKTFTHHPDTNTKIDDFKIPFLKESVQLAKKASLNFPTRIIGWDIALTNEGPLLVEGNSNMSLLMTDMAYGGYLKHPLIQEILNEIS